MRIFRYMRWILPALLLCIVPTISRAQVAISVTVAPPPLPVYEQPPCPEEGLMWVPGYWAFDQESGYYWVPGEWVPAPYVGALWTPPWWGWEGGRYLFHQGYWGNDVGYYGGINYGYGYMGVGFAGGEWRGERFAYNTAVMRVNRTVVHDTYVNETIVRNNTIVDDRRVAYNGGPSGIRHAPTPVEERAMNVRHTAPTPVQQQRIEAARADRNSFAKVNGGRPSTPVVARPAEATRTGEAGRPGTTAPGHNETRTPETRTPVTRTEPGRPESRPVPESRPESRPVPTTEHPRTETRPEPTPRPETRTVPQPHTEQRPVEPPRTDTHSAPEPRQESRPAVPPRTESRPAQQPEREMHPAPEPRQAPQPHTEARPAPEPRQVPQPHTEAHPIPEARQAPQPHTEARPAPQHESRPAPQHEAHPAPAPKPEDSKPEPH